MIETEKEFETTENSGLCLLIYANSHGWMGQGEGALNSANTKSRSSFSIASKQSEAASAERYANVVFVLVCEFWMGGGGRVGSAPTLTKHKQKENQTHKEQKYIIYLSVLVVSDYLQ